MWHMSILSMLRSPYFGHATRADIEWQWRWNERIIKAMVIYREWILNDGGDRNLSTVYKNV